MTHIGMSDSGTGIEDTVWGGQVSDEDYGAEAT